MKPMRIAYTMLLCLLFAAVTYARPQQDEPKSPAKPATERPEAKPEGPERQENAKPEKSEREKEANQDRRSDKDQQDKERAKDQSKEAGREQNHDSAHGRPAGKSAHIPDDKFRSKFGRQHAFKVSRPVVVNNRQTIEYGGYNFVLVDAWPAEWAYTDDVYLDYIDGEYFLFDLLHPGVRIAVFVAE